MKISDWLKPGLQIKRWFLIGLLGMLLVAIALSYPLHLAFSIFPSIVKVLLGILGLGLIVFALKSGISSLLKVCHDQNVMQGRLDRNKINKLFYDKRILIRGPKIVVIGGGTGLSVLLRGLKLVTSNITAIVTVADDGGGSGKLREDLGMLPPGDIRNCILALAEMEPTMEKLLQYRFEEGTLKGQSFGNLLIASMNGISSNFEDAIKKISEVLAVTGSVLPVTLDDVTLYARLKNGMIVKGESQIPVKSLEEDSPIEKVFIKPQQPRALQEALEAIENADVVILGPGSLYTSIIPNILIEDIRKSLVETTAMKVYIPNMMTQPGETDGYTVTDHVDALLAHCPQLTIDHIVINQGRIPQEIKNKYDLEGAHLILTEKDEIRGLMERKINVVEENLVDIKKDYVRHDANRLSKLIIDLVEQHRLTPEKSGLLNLLQLMGLSRE